MPPLQVLSLVHSSIYSSDKSSNVEVLNLSFMKDSVRAVAVKAQQQPQVPWFLIGDIIPEVLQSSETGAPTLNRGRSTVD